MTNAFIVAASVATDVVSFSSSGYGLSVNVPSDTASSGSGSIYLQISAPSGTQWIGFGQGSQMSGANMLVVYAADSSNVTVSPRLGTGHVEPEHNSDAQVSVLEGTGIASDGSLVANIRCDSCLSWSGGSMDPTDSSSKWIYAYKSGDALDATSTSADISQHDNNGEFKLDLTTGTGGSSSNPFVASSDDSSSTTAAGTTGTSTATGTAATAPGSDITGSVSSSSATATSTSGVSSPLTSSSPSSTGDEVESDPNKGTRTAHAILMPLVFVVLFPLSALTLYLPYNEKVRHVHAPLQVVSIILMLVGLAMGVRLANKLDEIDKYHQVIGFIVVGWMVIIQPALGLAQHLNFRKNGTRSPMGHGHRWVGRAMILLGIVNGGLGFMQAGKVGSEETPTYAVILYSAVAVAIFVLYFAVATFAPAFTARRNAARGAVTEKPIRPKSQGYEMHSRAADTRA
ncbi:hypothetical protein EDD36DRAFT_425561 [Exophiala viscosa]|uniref:DOMON domain-containing protein n=1 Tax=Exophiala viscosa TaxID=2486360 RepID=A0AAN6E6N3_9EURO|nr:hypothetical protein EDD36DRAFT_425561 [Exophiala viscosa]